MFGLLCEHPKPPLYSSDKSKVNAVQAFAPTSRLHRIDTMHVTGWFHPILPQNAPNSIEVFDFERLTRLPFLSSCLSCGRRLASDYRSGLSAAALSGLPAGLEGFDLISVIGLISGLGAPLFVRAPPQLFKRLLWQFPTKPTNPSHTHTDIPGPWPFPVSSRFRICLTALGLHLRVTIQLERYCHLHEGSPPSSPLWAGGATVS